MDKNEHIEQLIRKTLDQFGRLETLPPNPYLYSRIRHRLEVPSSKRGLFPASLKPALLTALVLLNMVVAYWHFTGAERNSRTDTRQELIDILARDLIRDPDHGNLSINE